MWVVEAKRWRPGVFAARTLLSDNSNYAAVRIVITSGFPFHLTKGRFVGDAKIAESTEEGRPSMQDGSGVSELGCSRGTGTDRIRPEPPCSDVAGLSGSRELGQPQLSRPCRTGTDRIGPELTGTDRIRAEPYRVMAHIQTTMIILNR